jgi:hypothetical protein
LIKNKSASPCKELPNFASASDALREGLSGDDHWWRRRQHRTKAASLFLRRIFQPLSKLKLENTRRNKFLRNCLRAMHPAEAEAMH